VRPSVIDVFTHDESPWLEMHRGTDTETVSATENLALRPGDVD
jgi:hypothetical protein